MAGRVDGVEAQLAERQHLAIIEPKPGERRRALVMHDHRNLECLAQLLGGGKVIGMGVRVDDIVDTYAGLRRQREIMVDPMYFRVDQRGDARVGATDEIGLTAARGNLLENHAPPLVHADSVDTGAADDRQSLER